MEKCKKFLIAFSPILVIMFIIVWALVGLEEALILLGSLLFTPTLGLILTKWIEFVDKHM